ncbi:MULTISPECIES: hypothetical protein [unclassified Streptomyces]|nr:MULTISPECIES: hypothetical protein [unclassified Streptomyces]
MVTELLLEDQKPQIGGRVVDHAVFAVRTVDDDVPAAGAELGQTWP